MDAKEVDQALARVRAGDTQAYGALVRAYQGDVLRVAAFALGSRGATEDLVQQAFVVAYQKLDAFEVGRDFGLWVRGIARNLVRDHVRKRAREDQRMKRYLAYLEARYAADADADEREQHMRDALARCREGLPDAAQQALVLRYDDGLAFDAVARAIGRTVAGARQLLQRARRDLRHCIEGRLHQLPVSDGLSSSEGRSA